VTVTSGTGAGVPDLFAEAHGHNELRAADWLSISVQPFGGAMASATVALHVREGIALSGLSAGLVTAGTASGEESWAGALVAARGCLRLLESARIEEGVRRLLPLGEPHESAYALLAPHRFAVAVDPTKTLGETMFGLLGRELGPAVAAPAGAADDDDPADSAPGSGLARLAREMTDVPAAVEVERPEVPDLTDDSLENTRRLFALTVAQLAELFGVTERQMHRYLREGLPDNRRALADALTAVGLTVIGGLGAHGARRWLYSGEPTAAELAQRGRIDELTTRVQALRDSPVT
jgi:hypothetical protein